MISSFIISSDETIPAIDRKSSSVVPVTFSNNPELFILTKSPVAIPAYTLLGFREK
jgi:hypothetical protein